MITYKFSAKAGTTLVAIAVFVLQGCIGTDVDEGRDLCLYTNQDTLALEADTPVEVLVSGAGCESGDLISATCTASRSGNSIKISAEFKYEKAAPMQGFVGCTLDVARCQLEPLPEGLPYYVYFRDSHTPLDVPSSEALDCSFIRAEGLIS